MAVLQHMWMYVEGDAPPFPSQREAYARDPVAYTAFKDVMAYIMRCVEDKYELRGVHVDPETAKQVCDSDIIGRNDGKRFAVVLAASVLMWEIHPHDVHEGIRDCTRPFMRFIAKAAVANNQSIIFEDVQSTANTVARLINQLLTVYMCRANCTEPLPIRILQIAACTLRRVE